MRPIALFFALFVGVPLIEIYLLIRVGGIIGAVWTICLVIATAALGAVLVKAQGFAILSRARTLLEAGEAPAMELLEGVCLLVAGALLLTPGFVTDALGFVLLTPAVRRHLIRHMAKRLVSHEPEPDANAGGTQRAGQRPPIEGDYERLD